MIDLDGRRMFVSSTASTGVVSSETWLHFTQRGARVVARYRGGSIDRGWLAGRYVGKKLRFRYAQREAGSAIHAGASVCDVYLLPDSRVRIVEHFVWSTRQGAGMNVFDEVPTSDPG